MKFKCLITHKIDNKIPSECLSINSSTAEFIVCPSLIELNNGNGIKFWKMIIAKDNIQNCDK